MKLLIINPGGTSTKIAVYEDDKEIFKKTVIHSADDLGIFPHVFDEYEYRKNLIIESLEEAGFSLKDLGCVAGRGGLMRPIEGGTYAVNDKMIDDLRQAKYGEHASNLGAVLAKSIGDELGIPSFVVDPVSVDEMMDKARIAGIKELERPSWFHALNHKAVSRFVANKLGKKYEECNFIVAHLGSGISIVAHNHGKMVDGSGGRTNGPFSPERSGGLPSYPLIKLCYSGDYTYEEMVKKVSTSGGIYDYLGTKDLLEIEKRIENGDTEAKLIYDAFAYFVAREISSYVPAFSEPIDRIIITGGIAHSDYITGEVSKMTKAIAPTEVVAGEFEMIALALGALRVLNGEEDVKIY